MKLKELIIFLSLNLTCVNSQSVKLIDISALTFNAGNMTIGRRLPPVSQLQCVSSGSAGCKNSSILPSVVQCYNVGNDGLNVQWKCNANLVSGIQFGQMVIRCEGFNNSTDPYVLVGSCGLSYKLDNRYIVLNSTKSPPISVGTIVGIVFGVAIFIGILIFVIVCCCFCGMCSKILSNRKSFTPNFNSNQGASKTYNSVNNNLTPSSYFGQNNNSFSTSSTNNTSSVIPTTDDSSTGFATTTEC